MKQEIGIREILDQLREELFQHTTASPKLFFIEGAEVELSITVKREMQGGIKISIVQFGGPEAGVSKAQEQGHKITLKLKPLISYEEARATLSDQERQKQLDALLKHAR